MIEDLLRDTLHAPDWDVPVSAGAMEDLRRRRRTHRRRTAGAAALGCLALVGATVVGVSLLPSHDAQLGTYATGGTPAGSPVPGITPAWVPEHGRDWLLTASEQEAFYNVHTHPSPGPGQSSVESPAPLGPLSETLEQQVRAAGLPAQARVAREDSVGGEPGATALHVTLPDGTPVEVSRRPASGPWSYQTGDAGADREITVEDIAGTTSAAVIHPNYGYGFGPKYDTAHGVITINRVGEVTTWAAPSVVPLDTLKAWAFAAARQSES